MNPETTPTLASPRRPLEDDAVGEAEKKKLKQEDVADTTELVVAHETLGYLRPISIIGRGLNNSSLAFLAEVIDHPGQAIVLLEQKPFTDETATQMISSETRVRLDKQNDIYYQYFGFPQDELHPIKAEVIYPATEKHIQKYTQQKWAVVRESPADYENSTKPYIASLNVKDIEWVYNILEHKKEADTLIVDDLDPLTGFALVPDFKWDQRDVNALYCLAIVRRRDIKSIRDLRGEHIPMLENVLEKTYAALKERYNVEKHHLRAYMHYQPSFYHLHVHFVSVAATPFGMEVDRAHLLEDVIDQLQADGDHFLKCNITFKVGSNFPLYEVFFPSEE